MNAPLYSISLLAFAVLAALPALAADEKQTPETRKEGGNRRPSKGEGGNGNGGAIRPQDAPLDDVRFIFKTEVPAHPLDVVLGRPSKNSVTLSVLSYADREAFISHGPVAGAPNAKTKVFSLKEGIPLEIALTELQANTRYFYRLHTRQKDGAWTDEAERSFHTARPPGSAFTFTMQADPHLDYNTEPSLYLRCLSNALADQPDFLIDLGDTFMNDKHRAREGAAAQYVAQRYYFGTIAHSAPLFLILGNHDGEAGRWLDGKPDNLSVWSNMQRKRYFPNPIPDSFYTGNATADPQAGLLQNYYAWEWGDALFIALDPFWFSKKERGGLGPGGGQAGDNWSTTLGREQYDWLASTLTKSRAKFRFVFLHHLVGGLGKDARGGAEAAPLYEWGGQNADGTDVFREKRPGWPMPIHELLLKNKVSAVFHGHDHLFVKQDRDGIVYQEVPQPGHARYDNTRSAEEYGYKSGTLQGSSGHLRVRVEDSKATVDYVRAYLASDENSTRKNGAVSFSYQIQPR